jgi:WD40 repeat protein
MLAKTGVVAVAVCDDQKLRVWNLPKGQLLRELNLGKRAVDAAVVSADGRRVAVGDHKGSYTVWNLSTGAEALHVQLPNYPFAVALSSDGTRLAIAPAGEPVQIYEVESGMRLFDLQRPIGGTAAVAFSADGRRIGTADADTVVRSYDARNGELLARHTDFLLPPLATVFTPDGKRLLAAGGDKVIATLDSSTGTVVRKSAKLADPVSFLDVSPDGVLTMAALLHADNMLMPAPVIIFETESGRKVQEWVPATRVLGGAWTQNGDLIVATGSDRNLHIWRLR